MDKLFGSKKETKTVLTQEIQSGVVTELPQVFNEFVFGEPVKSIGTTFLFGILKPLQFGK